MNQCELTIITPMHNEQEVIDHYFKVLVPILEKTQLNWEIIAVDDGSSDSTLDKLNDYHHQISQLKILSLSRNFGKEAALTAGLDHASGQAVILIDADLQDPPELIPKLIEKWHEGYDVVLAQRSIRKEDSLGKRISALAFYKLMRRIATTDIPENTGDYRLMTRKVIMAIQQMPERVRFMKGILSWPGFNTSSVSYERPQRVAGKTSFNFTRLLRLAFDGIISFSDIPLKIWTWVGLTISLISFIYALFIIFKKIFLGISVPGYASLITAILFMGGIQLISLGVLGEYIGRIYLETKKRPIYLVDKKIGWR